MVGPYLSFPMGCFSYSTIAFSAKKKIDFFILGNTNLLEQKIIYEFSLPKRNLNNSMTTFLKKFSRNFLTS